jgi:transcriptional regulator with XRE-family HTH domain
MTVLEMQPWGARYARLVAEEVRSEAARQRVTGAQLAGAVGLSPQAMSRRMIGTLPFAIDELAEVAKVLHVEVADLLPAPRRADTIGYLAPVLRLVEAAA